MKLNAVFFLFLTGVCFFFCSCKKSNLEPNINGTWQEINNTTDQTPTGCELVINSEEGEVSICGITMVRPYNTPAVLVKKRSLLYIRSGQIWYKQRLTSFFWSIPGVGKDIYFMDYDFEGSFLWVIGDNSSSKATAKGKGKLFRKI